MLPTIFSPEMLASTLETACYVFTAAGAVLSCLWGLRF